jgi:ketosteroid isomerase-like protein
MSFMRYPIVLLLVGLAAGCESPGISMEERAQIAARIERDVKAAYDLKSPEVVKNLQRLYPDTGRIVSVQEWRVFTGRDTIFQGISEFWRYVGSNMKNPTWMWDRLDVDVISRDAAVMTAAYHVPHTTPAGRPHTIGGAWTAVFRRDGDRWVIVQEHLSDIPAALADSTHAAMGHTPTRARPTPP